jgi:hypothetical protein
MRNIIVVLCFFLLFSCTKKNTLNTEKKEIIENNPMVDTFNEDLDKEIYNELKLINKEIIFDLLKEIKKE